jgi:uncharacterized protein (TIGR01777 family)
VKVLVTGASGFIGSALCDSLLLRGDTVAGLTRDPQRARGTNPSVTWHPWEPTLERPPAAAFENVDGVIHLLGEKINQRWTPEAKQRILESRRTGTHNLVGTISALQRKPRVLVSQSAIGFYGDRGEAMVDESSEGGDGFGADVVREWEKAAREVAGTGVRLAIIRTGHVLDPRGGFLGPQLTPFKLGVGGPLAGGNQYVSWIHIADEIGILLWALENEKVSGVVNATAPNPVTNKVFSKALGKALGRPAVVPVPGLAVDLMYGKEFGQVVRGGQRVIPRRAQDLGYKFEHPELDEALEDLF